MRRVQIRKVADLGTGHTPSRSVPEYWVPEECTIPWLTLADVKQVRDGKTVITETSEKISAAGVANSSAVVHPAGTVAFSRTASVGFSCILGTEMATSQDWVTWTCGPHLDPCYLLWVLRGERNEILGRTQGSTHKTIYMPDIEELTVPLPPVEDQRQIAKFLDVETDHIDQLSSVKRRMSQCSEELRRSIVYEAVAGSLTANNSDSELRVSTIPWLHSVPVHWQEASLRLVAELGSGHTPSRSHPEWWIDCTVPWVTTGEVARLRSDRHEYIYETRERVSELGLGNSSAVVHPAGTVVLCRTSASAGYSGIMAEDMATSQDFATWTCGPLLRPRFLLLCLRAMRRDLLERLGQGSTHVTIYMPDIESIRVPLPPVEEQDRIVDEAWRRMSALAEAEDVLDKQITLLEERRRSLVTAAVSGEMEVP